MSSVTDEFGNRNAVIMALDIVGMIPESEKEFREDMRKLLLDYAYVSPEMQFNISCWMKLDVVLKRHIPDANCEGWKKNIVETFVGKPIPVG